MFQQFSIHLNHAGHPFARVPASSLWDLIEYLSYQRVHANYHFEDGDFHITFPTLEPATVQRILNEWAHAESEALCTA